MVDLTSKPASLPLPIRIITHNIRYATSSPYNGELPWPKRKDHLLAQLQHHTRFIPTSIICLQEVLHSQLSDIQTSLGSSWSYVGVGRDNGKTAGEYSPIFFQSEIWERLFSRTIWLSPTPDVPGSKGWDAACVRILNVTVLQHRESGKEVLVLNTHLDDQGSIARREGAKLIVDVTRTFLSQFDLALNFLAGDLNSPVGGEAYEELNREGSGFMDIRKLVDEKDAYGHMNTFTGFDGNGDGDRVQRIDFIHLGTAVASGNEHTTGLGSVKKNVQGYAVLPNRFGDNVYLSDHRAVVADVVV